MKILFITHDCFRTGAPLVLLYFLQWIKKHQPEIGVTVLALEGGALSEEFKAVSNNYYQLSEIKTPVPTFSQDLKKRVLKKLKLYVQKPPTQDIFFEGLAKQDFDLVYANTVVSVPVAHKIKNFNPKIKLAVHVHELKTIITLKLPNLKDYLPKVDLFIAVSELVKKDLEEIFLVQENKIKTIYGFTRIGKGKKEKNKQNFIVGGVGTVHWRKGSDLFIQVARYIQIHFPQVKIKFIWVGAISGNERKIIEADLEKAGLEKMVSFVGQKDNPIDHYSDFDIFLLPSREDPFPLVAIEMGMLGKPIICFEKATGTAEILEKGGGYVVPYLDIEAMAKKIVFYYENRAELAKDGEKAKDIFSGFTSEKISPHLFSVLKHVVNEP